MSEYSEFWKSLRKEHGVSQKEIALALGVAVTFVSSVERGLCRYSLAQTIRLMKFLDLDPALIMALILSDQEKILRKILK